MNEPKGYDQLAAYLCRIYSVIGAALILDFWYGESWIANSPLFSLQNCILIHMYLYVVQSFFLLLVA